MRFFVFVNVVFLVLIVFSTSRGEQFDAVQIEFFEKEIRPILVESCLDCHTGTKANVGLQLDHRDGWLRGSDYRKVIDLEYPEQSVLLHAIKQTGKLDTQKMPKKGKPLSADAISKIEQWIVMGLPWPEEQVRRKAKPSSHWSFQPVNPPALTEDGVHPIDYFIRKAHDEKQLSMAPPADGRTLYRRIVYNLTGLPPTYEDVGEFLNKVESSKESAWEMTIDQLLASPHYGERWARHWMDIARYSDTKGYEAGGRERRFMYSYTYRDWLINAFNDDMAFDQFLLYQLAADKMIKDWTGPDKHHLAAMGFISLSKNGAQELVLDDRVDTTFRGMMGLTVSCARCHDHKFDPVSTKEYYSLYGIFRNSMESRQPQIGDIPDTPEYKAYLTELERERKKVSDFLAPHLAEAKKKFPKLAKNEAQLKAKLDRETLKKARNLQIKVDKFIANKRMEPAKALVVTDRARPLPQNIYIRGNPARKGEVAPPQFLKLASQVEPAAFTQGSGRLEMAHAIADRENPLTARVIVNRVWMWHFGEGIVRTVSDFGTQGEKPDHPELLDWLANWFVENGWSIKKLHRLILTSDTWRQSSVNPHESSYQMIDPENRLLWKSFVRRLDFEQMRDSYLAVTGNLDRQQFGLTEKILQPPFSNRRSIYGFIDRQNLSSVFRHFDFSNPQETTGQRPKTTIPMQALFTLNSPFVMKQAGSLSKKSENEEDRVAFIHRHIFAKEPSESDRLMAESFINGFSSKDDKIFRQNLSGWSYGWGGFNKDTEEITFNPFRYWDPKSKSYRIKKEYPLKGTKQSYLSIGRTSQHPGSDSEHCAILRWHAPRSMEINIGSMVRRDAVGKGRTGLLLDVVSSRTGLIVSSKLDVSAKSIAIDLANLQVEEGEIIHFIADADSDLSFDSYQWDPTISNANNPGERWKMTLDLTEPKQPLTAWEAYTQALLNTNRFLFIQ